MQKQCFCCGESADGCAGAARAWCHCPQLPATHRESECIQTYHRGCFQHLLKRLCEEFDVKLSLAALTLTEHAEDGLTMWLRPAGLRRLVRLAAR
jgi:hypothetical protein